MPRASDKQLELRSDLPLGKNAQAIKLDSNVSWSNNLMQWPDSIGPKKEIMHVMPHLKLLTLQQFALLSVLQKNKN